MAPQRPSPRPLILREWTPWAGALTLEEAARLASDAGDILDVDLARRGGIVVRPKSWVGRLRTTDFDVSIEAKVPVESILAMLGEAFDGVTFSKPVGVGGHHTIEDLIVRAFLADAEALLRQGLHRIYTEESDTLSAVRGRVLVRETTDLFLRGVPRVACRFEEFTPNTIENQVLAAALRAVAMNTVLQPAHRQMARRLAVDFVDVDEVRTIDVAGIRRLGLDVRTRHYRRPLALAEMILRAMGFQERHGTWRASGFLINMNQLFETVLSNRFVRGLTPRGFTVERQFPSSLDVGGKIAIRPDIIVRERRGQVIIVDAKYKDATTPAPADLYQMVAYCRALGVTDAVLIDVATGPERHDVIRDGVIVIHTLHVDLSSMTTLSATVDQAIDRVAALLSPGSVATT